MGQQAHPFPGDSAEAGLLQHVDTERNRCRLGRSQAKQK